MDCSSITDFQQSTAIRIAKKFRNLHIESKRTLVGNIGLALALTMSGVYQPWLVKALGDWKIFNWILFAQMALVVFTPVIMPESCR